MSKSADAFRTISEVADWLGVQTHVLRFWESKFTQVKPVKRAGGRRYYRPVDMLLLGGIRKLLHDDGLTIKGVQKVLREKGIAHVSAMSHGLDEVSAGAAAPAPSEPEPAAPAPADAPAEAAPEATASASPMPDDPEPASGKPDGDVDTTGTIRKFAPGMQTYGEEKKDDDLQRPSFTQDAVVMPGDEQTSDAAAEDKGAPGAFSHKISEDNATEPQKAEEQAAETEPETVPAADAAPVSDTDPELPDPPAPIAEDTAPSAEDPQEAAEATPAPEKQDASSLPEPVAQTEPTASDSTASEPAESDPEPDTPDVTTAPDTQGSDADDTPPADPPSDDVVFRASARGDEATDDAPAEPGAAQDSGDTADAIPSFLSFARRTAPLMPPSPPEDAKPDAPEDVSEKTSGTAAPVAEPEPEPEPVPDAPKPIILDVPDVPDEKNIPAEPALLSKLSTAAYVAPEAAALIGELTALRDRMTAARKE